MDVTHIIEPERQGLWIAAGFIIALLALVVGLAAIQKINTVFVGTQAEVVALNNKIEKMKASQPTQPQPTTPAAAAK
jgi:hypothetical protein